MRPITKHSLALMLVAMILLTTDISEAGEAKIKDQNQVSANEAFKYTKPNSEQLIYSVEIPIIETEKRPNLDIPLSSDIQEYIWECSNRSDISYSMLLALANTESKFDYKAISKTNDYGLFQLNKSTAKWIASEMDLKQYNLLDPRTNTDMTIWLLAYLREYWRSKGLSDEEVFNMTILSYHHGLEGSKKYIRQENVSNYLRQVKEYKSNYESET